MLLSCGLQSAQCWCISSTLVYKFLWSNSSANGLHRTQSPIRLASTNCSQCQVVSVWLQHWPSLVAQCRCLWRKTEENLVCGELGPFQPLRKRAAHKRPESRASPWAATDRMFHGASTRVKIDMRVFCKWRKRLKKHSLSRHRMKEKTIWTFHLYYQVILVIMKVAARLHIIFSLNPYGEIKFIITILEKRK